MFGESHPTHQARIYHQEHLDRRERIAQKAVPDAGINLRKKKTIPELPKKIIVAVKPKPILPDPPILRAPPKRDWLFLNIAPKPVSETFPPNFILYIKRIVAREFNVSVVDIDSACRSQDCIIPRHIAINLAKGFTLKSLPEIGRKFGGRDHTTILAALRSLPKKMRADQELAGRYSELETRISDVLISWRQGVAGQITKSPEAPVCDDGNVTDF